MSSKYATSKLVYALSAILLGGVLGQTTFSYPRPGKFPVCLSENGAVDRLGLPLPENSEFYFDEAGIECRVCGVNKETEVGGSKCKCKIGFYKVENPGENALSVNPDNDFECESCAATLQTSYRDGSSCCGCDGSTGAVLVPGQSDCSCQSIFRALSEVDNLGNRLPNKICKACSANSRVIPPDFYTCVSCPDKNMILNADGDCECPYDEFTTVENVCLSRSSSNPIQTLYPPSDADVQTQDDSSSRSTELTSLTFQNMYLINAVRCRADHLTEANACQAIGNLCVLAMYDNDHAVCKLFKSIMNLRVIPYHGFQDWKEGLPWIYVTGDDLLYSTALQSEVTLSTPTTSELSSRSKVHTLKFKIATYALNGTFLGLEDLTSQLQLCAGSKTTGLSEDSDDLEQSFLKFGTSFENKCTVSLLKFLQNDNPTLFYDLYIVDKNNRLFPVPVKLINYRSSGTRYANLDKDNEEIIDGQVTLHRRFYLMDTVSGVTQSGVKTDIISYAKKLTLRVTAIDQQLDRIHPPVLVIEYVQRETNRLADGRKEGYSELMFRTEYSMDLESLFTTATWLFGFSIVGAIGLWVIRLGAWWKVNPGNIDILFVARAFVFLMASCANFFFYLALILTGYAFIFFKLQAVPYFLLPTESPGDELEAIYTLISLAFIGKLFEVFFLVWNQCTLDIFLLDWERPTSETDEISCWRTLFIANEFCEVMMDRSVNVNLVLFGIVLLYEGHNFFSRLGVGNLATAQPDFTNLNGDMAPIDPFLRFFVSTFWWLLLAGTQLMFNRLVMERFFGDPAGQFVDICSLSNISLFLFDSKKHCYYIHGKTVHEHTEVSMEGMARQISNEEKQLTPERGIVPGVSIDTAEIYLTREFVKMYDTIYRDVLRGKDASKKRVERQFRRNERRGPLDTDGPQELIQNKLIRANKALARQLGLFINRNAKSPKWKYLKTRGRLRKRFDWAPEVEEERGGENMSIIYNDQEMRWTRTILRGLEYDIILLLSLVYAVFDMGFRSPLVSVFACFVVNSLINYIRSRWGKVNLSKKTLVDQRFLL